MRHLAFLFLLLSFTSWASAWEKTNFFMEGETARLEVSYPGYPITAQVTAFGRSVTLAGARQAFETKLRNRTGKKETEFFGTIDVGGPLSVQVRYVTLSKVPIAHIMCITGIDSEVVAYQFNIELKDPKSFKWEEFSAFANRNYTTLARQIQGEVQVFLQTQYNPFLLFNGK